MADINIVSFVLPTTALLQAHYFNIPGVFTDDFPGNPPIPFNYTGNPPTNIQTMNGTRLYRLPYNATVQIVFQGTAVIAPENHPSHLHGYNFFVVGKRLGNIDSNKDPQKFNLVDPVERNTVAVPTAGWIAIRFKADNPGKTFGLADLLSYRFLMFHFFRYNCPTFSKFNQKLIQTHPDCLFLFLDNEVTPSSMSCHGKKNKKL